MSKTTLLKAHQSASNLPAMAMQEQELLSVLSSSLYPGAKPESIRLVLNYCRAAGLDPMQKPVHIVPMRVKIGRDNYEWRDVVMPGIGLYRVQAARSGEYAGVSDPEFGATKTLAIGQDSIEYPEWCRVTVKRLVHGHLVEFTAREFWLENYATAGRDSKVPNSMWQRRPFAQLAKCAEAQALRKAFPEIGAQPTADEMEGKVIDAGDGTVIDGETGELVKHAVQQPRAKSEAAAAPTTATAVPSDKPASPNMVKMVRTKLGQQDLIDEAALCAEFEIANLEDAGIATVNKMLARLNKIIAGD